MKILFDTNVLISAIITNGRSADVLKLCLTKHMVVTSHYILEELEEKLLVLNPYHGIPILKPTPFIDWERSHIP